MDVVNPATGKKVRQYPEHKPAEIPAMVEAVHDAQQKWRRVSFKERAGKMLKAAEVLKKNAKNYARLMAEEMGKPVKQGAAEAEKCAWVCEYYAEHAEKFLAP